MMPSITVEAFPEAVKAILDEFESATRANLDEALAATATDTKNEVRASAKSLFQHHKRNKTAYWKTWKVKKEKGRLGNSYIIYADNGGYQIAHLLENGHKNRDGSFTQGRPHITPAARKVESTIVKNFKEAMK